MVRDRRGSPNRANLGTSGGLTSPWINAVSCDGVGALASVYGFPKSNVHKSAGDGNYSGVGINEIPSGINSSMEKIDLLGEHDHLGNVETKKALSPRLAIAGLCCCNLRSFAAFGKISEQFAARDMNQLAQTAVVAG